MLDLVFDFVVHAPENEELNPLLAGYFSKLVLCLLNYKKTELISYMFEKPKLLETLIDHVYDRSISEVIIKISTVSSSLVSMTQAIEMETPSEEDNQLMD